MITVMKASAGSGKTHELAGRYIKMLLDSDDPRAYRHILAVTFTNKATDEMKSRIIEELFKSTDPKAGKILNDILHDYGSFAVSTIDKFFQQTLRAFARELGQFSRYQVELDKDALVDEAVDTILDELKADDPDDRKMINFIVEHMEDRMSEGGGLKVEEGLKEMARQLKSETFARKSSEIGMDRDRAYASEELSALKKTCLEVISSFEKKVRGSASAVKASNAAAALEYGDYKRGWLAFIEKFIEWDRNSGNIDKLLSPANIAKISDPSPSSWFTKDNVSKFNMAFEAVGGHLQEFLQLWSSDEYKAFVTASMLLEQVYGLGVAARLFKTFDRVTRDRNVVCLDESNSLLRNIIDGSDAPFVYEKTGVRFKTFLLDEFQDTSSTQWDNFLPLLRESEASGEFKQDHSVDNLVVGDVKQSIYRWRESDWSLLDHQVEASFPGSVHSVTMLLNWRSLSEIVDFNNSLYPYLAGELDSLLDTPRGQHSISEIYRDCSQTPGRGERQRGGSVDVEFVEDDATQLQRILDTVKDLKDNHGASYGDIAILVRKKSSGTDVAGLLVENGIKVVTDASLRLKNSLTVRRLVSMMSYVENPEDKVGAYIGATYSIDDGIRAYHSLPDLAESLYRVLCSDKDCAADCRKETMYVASFMDFVMDYSNSNGNGLKEFLSFWRSKDPAVNASSGDDAVHIITIHKSKGLAFPYVIVPFVETITLYEPKRTRVWASPEPGAAEFERFRDRLFYVPLNEKAASSHFSGSYALEKFNQGVDAINLLYVATTRAEKGMKILANIKSKGASGSMAALLAGYCSGQDLHLGSIYDFSSVERKPSDGASLDLAYPIYDISDRLSIRPYAADFFSREDNKLDSLSFRERGIVLHDVLGRIVAPSDLKKALDDVIDEGKLSADSRDRVESFLKGRISRHPEFFPVSSDVKVLLERDVIAPDGRMHRPDRVLLYPDGRAVIVDYKFGTMSEEYTRQIEDYRLLFQSMGYTDVKALLWFVYQDNLF